MLVHAIVNLRGSGQVPKRANGPGCKLGGRKAYEGSNPSLPTTMSDFYDELRWRGLVHSETQGLGDQLRSHKTTCYIGFDPTASSLHVGSLLPLMTLARFQKAGHPPIAILGGATGRIGDPSGKTSERPVLSTDELERNLEGIAKQIRMFVDVEHHESPGLIIDNSHWLLDIRLLDFLRDVGRHFGVSQMLGREAVRARLERVAGMTYTEFSYGLLQAYDYLVLHHEYGCTLQMGGSDQWGNIVTGIDLIRKVEGATVHGLVFPLVTTSSGTKFGKTEAGTVWLDGARTSPFAFYQFWLNANDEDVIKYLKYFTWLPRGDVEELEQNLNRHPEERTPHRTLASHVTREIHGEEAAVRAEKAAGLLFGEPPDPAVSGAIAEELLQNLPSYEVQVSLLANAGVSLIDIAVQSGFLKSRGEARRLIAGGGFYVNGQRVDDANRVLSLDDQADDGVIVLRKGRKQYFVLRLV